ncbi:putative DNA-directed polymerase kappa [Hortaea werneckii]|nr:putative DNA-directed polymerase kappa [Hortaea werneckii]KAI6859496.1 putative DNA-directed polymerase kappa [Hortaea werneckii]KAI7172391.1 putative DNA-directed polymerase kappa [Hortaea werneckii]KAI7348902.1 putative DNA-directed polymerase kappa [Hortaea werneckii]KAI7606775.1 putative DNA-directed polymerase kappa [Hortaea werneckii]
MPRHNADLVDEAEIAIASASDSATPAPPASQHHTLKYHLLGPSLTKSGQDGVDQQKVSEIIYNASKGSKYFNNEENKDKTLTVKIQRILAKKRELERIEASGGLRNELKRADDFIAELEYGRDLSQAVVHVDCDAFYAAVEELDRPELKEVPFAVGKGVLTTCNYVARKFGCRSGMAGFVADKLCPQLIHLPLNFDKYTAKAKEVRAVLEQYDPRFESASIDEAYLNITEYCREHNMEPEDAVAQMRAEVEEKTKITISAGIAANAKLAKVCSNKNKPNGQFRLPSDRSSIVAFMRDLPTRKVNGIGRVFERELDAIGVKTCGDIYPLRHYLSRLFGEKAFQFLISVYLGLGRTDVRPVEEYERKSVGTESTFHDLSDPQELREKLKRTAEELEKDLRRTEFKGRTLVLKIKLHTYEVFSRQVQPPKAVYTAEDLYHYSLPMLAKLEKEMPGMKLRLMGLRYSNSLTPLETGFLEETKQWAKWNWMKKAGKSGQTSFSKTPLAKNTRTKWTSSNAYLSSPLLIRARTMTMTLLNIEQNPPHAILQPPTSNPLRPAPAQANLLPITVATPTASPGALYSKLNAPRKRKRNLMLIPQPQCNGTVPSATSPSLRTNER